MSKHTDINQIFTFGDYGGYESLLTGDILFNQNAELLIQFDYGGECHYDTHFLLIEAVGNATLILEDLKFFEIDTKLIDKMISKLKRK